MSFACKLTVRRLADASRRGYPRTAISALEVVVSFTLLSSVLTFSAPLIVRHGRLLAAQRNYRLALDELSNQLQRLSALPAEELPAAIEQIAPSAFVAARLPGAELRGALKPADFGQCLTLQLLWDEPQRRTAPVTLTGWIAPTAAPRDSGSNKEQES
jgi:hypothetical protein